MPEQLPLVSIVMPIFNGAGQLGLTLESLARQSIPATDVELIMVDDGSSDGSHLVVARASLPFHSELIRQANAGLSVARNRGLAKTRGTTILFLDQDIVADPGLIHAHVDCHRRYGPALVGGRRVPWPGARTSLVTRVLDLESTGNVPPHALVQHPYQIVIGANFSIARADIVALGGFDEDFPAGGGFEDVELAYRAYRAGLKVVYCERAVGSHNHPKSLRSVCEAARRYARSGGLLFSKHPELEHAFPFLADKQPISCKADSPRLIVRKLGRRVFALAPVLHAMTAVVQVLEKACPAPRLLSPLYRIIIGSYQLRGYREGRIGRAS